MTTASQAPPALNVLFIEDSPDDVELMLRALHRGGISVREWRRVETEADLRSALMNNWDAAVSDYHLPQFNAPAALAVLAEVAPDLPCIVASGAIGEEAAAAVMRSGAVDFVTKGHLDWLAEALRRSVEDALQRRRRAEAEERLAAARQRAETLKVELAEMQQRRDRVVQLNDEVLQRLVVARAGLATGDIDSAIAAVTDALVAVRDVMVRLLPVGVEPGMLRLDARPETVGAPR